MATTVDRWAGGIGFGIGGAVSGDDDDGDDGLIIEQKQQTDQPTDRPKQPSLLFPLPTMEWIEERRAGERERKRKGGRGETETLL